MMKIFGWLLLGVLLLLTGCTEEAQPTPPQSQQPIENEATSDSSEPVTPTVCPSNQQYLADEMICALPLECGDKDSCFARGEQLITTLQSMYGSLVEEETVEDVESGLEIIATYTIDLNNEYVETHDDIPQALVDYHANLWFDFSWLIPESERPDLDHFEIFRSEDTLAHMYINNPDEHKGRWTLGMNEQNIELASETMVTYIHEFAHLLSLRDSEVDYYANTSTCKGVWADELCLRTNSYLAQYYDRFYKNIEQQYSYEWFISDYATMSMEEDFAESFAHFILSKYPQGNEVVDKKLQFFYDDDHLVQLRVEILRRAATWLELNVVFD